VVPTEDSFVVSKIKGEAPGKEVVVWRRRPLTVKSGFLLQREKGDG